MSPKRIGSVTATVAAILFGTSNVATVFLLQSFTPVGGAFWRAITAAVLLAIIVVVGRVVGARADRGAASPPPPMSARVARALVIGVCGGPLFLVSLNLAVAGVGATVTAFVSGLYAVFAVMLAPFVLGEPLRRRVIVGFVCALAGIALLSKLQPDPEFAAGFVAALVAASVYAFYLVLGRRWSASYQLSPQGLTAASIGSTIAALAIWIPLVSPGELGIGEPQAASLIALGVMATTLAVGQMLVLASVRRINAARTAAFLLLNPVTATILAALMLRERLNVIQLVGATMVLIGMGISIGLDLMIRPAAPITRTS